MLIHAGCSPVGLAAISLASVMGCAVYTTVATDYQRAYLKKHFVFVSISNVQCHSEILSKQYKFYYSPAELLVKTV